MSTDFEYAIKKDVRNNKIIREVDEARQRQFWRSLGTGGVLVVVVLFSVWQKVELLQHGYRIQKLQQEQAAEVEINRRLRLEVETLRAPERIENMAKELNLVAPPRDRAIVIERVTPSAPPDKSVVAAR
ncbi:MAG: cell division protein FtsL [Acidobacteria bacterium]|nr:cell division protein FtsL [Acidobacteriota bacterium]